LEKEKIALIGYGYWGKKLYGYLKESLYFDLVYVHFRSLKNLDEAALHEKYGKELVDWKKQQEDGGEKRFLFFSPQVKKTSEKKIQMEEGSKEPVAKHAFFDTSGNGRMSIWLTSFNIIKYYPFLGTGLDTFSKVAPLYGIPGGYYTHNCYLHMAVEIGIVGFLSFLWILLVFFRKTMFKVSRLKDRLHQAVLLGGVAGLLGFFAHSFLDTNFYSVQLNTLMWVMLGLVVATQKIFSEDL